MTLEEIIQSIHSLENYLQKFEEKYKLRSDDFYEMAKKEKLEHTPDFVEWFGVYEIKLKRIKQYHKLISNKLDSQSNFKIPLDEPFIVEA